MATTLVCGLECNILDANGHVVAGNGSPVFDTGTVASGGSTRSIKIPAAGSALDALLPGTSFSSATAVVRFKVNVASFTAAQDIFLGGIRSAPSNNLYVAIEGSSGKFCLFHQVSWANRVVSNVTAVAGQWYTFDISADYGASPTADWRIDGVAQTSLTSANFTNSSSTWSNLTLGQRAAAGGDPTMKTYTAYYDDVAISLTSGDYPLTHTGVKLYVPGSDGTHSTGAAGNFTDGTSNITGATTTAYTLLDEVPPTTTDKVVQALDTSGALYVEVRFNSTTETATPLYVDALGVWRAATAASAAGQVKLRDNLGSTDDAIVNTTIAVTTDTYWRKHYAARPAALGAWTVAALNDLRARLGFGTDVTPDIWFGGVLVEVGVSGADSTVTVPSTPAVTGAANTASAKVQPSAGAATATGAANTAAASVKPNAQAPAATVAVGNASVIVKPSAESTAIAAWVTEGAGSDVTLAPGAVTATVASADAKATVSPAPSAVAATVSVPDAAARTGTTVQPAAVAIAAAVQTPSATVLPAAGTTSATVAIADASASVEVQGGLPSPQAAVQAFDAVVVAISGTFVSAGAAAITGTASDAAAAITAAAEATSVSGAANAASAAVKPTGGAVSVTGAAYSVSATTVLAGQATITGAASSAAASVKPAAAAATVTGSATSPSVGITSPAGSVAVTGAAYSAKASVQPSAGAPAVTGSASTASVSVKAPASAATVSGSAPAASASVAASAERAAVIAAVAAAIASVKPSGGLVEITAASYQATRAGLVGVGPGPRGGTAHHHGPRGGTGHHVPRGSARDIRPR